jgi:hypothetical protein
VLPQNLDVSCSAAVQVLAKQNRKLQLKALASMNIGCIADSNLGILKNEMKTEVLDK